MVTGADGLLGSALRRVRIEMPECAWTFVGRDRDLCDAEQVARLFADVQPTHVIHAAARVGGFQKNHDAPEEMFHANVLMNTLVIHQAAVSGVRHFIGFGSNCMFDPNLSELTTENIHHGAPYANNAAYGFAKRMIDIHLDAAQRQYGMQTTYLVPPSMYGPHDNFSLRDGHVVASLIHKCALARQKGEDFIRVWGDGTPIREVAFSEDIARIALGCFETAPRRLVISSGQELSIKEMAETIANIMGIKHLVWETDKPAGQLRRPTAAVHPYPFTPFAEGIRKTCAWFADTFPRIRC
jgi:GDP-L-fucose synthase